MSGSLGVVADGRDESAADPANYRRFSTSELLIFEILELLPLHFLFLRYSEITRLSETFIRNPEVKLEVASSSSGG